jgi:hypothetical protein
MTKRLRAKRVAPQTDVEVEPYGEPGDSSLDPAERAIETAAYIADMTGELARLAAKAELDTLSYLLAMAHVEAEVLARASHDHKD